MQQAKQDFSMMRQPISSAINKGFIEPVKKEYNYTKKVSGVKSQYAKELWSLGITAQTLDEMWLSDEEKQAVKAIYAQVGAKIPWLEEIETQQQAMAQEQARQWEDLWFFGSIIEWAKWIWQAGMYIPELAGNIGSMIPWAMWEIAWFAGSALWVERENNPFYTSLKEWQRATQRAGQMVTWAGVDNLNLTEKQKEARRTWAMLALTAPVPVKGLWLVKWTGLGATALRGWFAWAQGTTAYMAASEWRLPTGGELAMWTAWWAALWPVLEKAVIPWIAKWAEMVNRKLNPSKFVQQIDDETIWLVRKAVRPSVTWVDSVSKFDVQDEKLLQWVKEVVKQWKKPKNARELMDAVADTKKAIWSKVQESNKAVLKTTSGDEIATKVRNIVNDSEYDELFANNPSLEAELLKFADDVVTNKRFQNLSQEKLQNYLVDINGRLPQTAFQKSLASNPTQTAKDTLIAKVYKEILDDNLEQAVWMAGKEARMAYWAVRQLEKDFAKRYAVYLRQNPQGLADMFGMEWFADMAVWLLTWSPAQVGRGVIMQWVKKLIKAQNSPDTIIRDIFNLQGKLKNVKAPSIVKKNQQLLLPAPSGKATWAKNFRVNQPKEAPAIKGDITGKSKIVRPWTSAPIKEDIAKTLLNQKARQQTLSNLKNDIARSTEQARYGGTGNSRIEQGIQKAINDWTLTPDEAKVFAREILQDIESGKGRYSYINKPKLKEYVDWLTGKKETFEELLTSKPAEVVAPKTQTPKQIYDKLNEMANDWRYGEKSWNALADEFKQKTGKDIMDMWYDSFDIDWNVKVTPKTIVKPKITKEWLQAKVNIAKGKIAPKKIESSPIVKKEAQKTIVKPVEKTNTSEISKESYIRAIKSLQEKPNRYAWESAYLKEWDLTILRTADWYTIYDKIGNELESFSNPDDVYSYIIKPKKIVKPK